MKDWFDGLLEDKRNIVMLKAKAIDKFEEYKLSNGNFSQDIKCFSSRANRGGGFVSNSNNNGYKNNSGNTQNTNNFNNENNFENVIRYTCGGFGHFSFECSTSTENQNNHSTILKLRISDENLL